MPPQAPRDRAHALAFGAVARTYERSRPGYPDAALDRLLPAGARRVADVGAGTGKLTRLLVARGLDVVAVEPDGAMRAELARAVPAARVVAGTGEAVPLPDASMDAVLFAQSWHWVDPVAGSAEAARVLAPGGRLCLLWNARDSRVGWVADLGRLLEAASAHSPEQYLEADVRAPFGPVEAVEVGWRQSMTPQGLVDLVASRSYVIVKPDAEREALLDAVRDLVATHPDLAGAAEFELPYVTRCYHSEPLPT